MSWFKNRKGSEVLETSTSERISLYENRGRHKAKTSGDVVDAVDVIELTEKGDGPLHTLSSEAEHSSSSGHIAAHAVDAMENEPGSSRADTFGHASSDELLELPEIPLSTADPGQSAGTKRKWRWGGSQADDKKAKGSSIASTKLAGGRASSERASSPRSALPIKVLIGYLPESSEKDTYFYMLGVAQKNLETENIGYAGLMKFESGYAYEIHEGGEGRGYLDSLITHFRSLPAFSAEEGHHAFIRTTHRTVRVERTPNGLYSVMLPESDTTPQSEWLVPGKKLKPLVDKRTGFFLGGVVIFLSGVIALMVAYATRYQPYTPAVVNLERVPVEMLPHSQWDKLMKVTPPEYVTALEFSKGEWLIRTPGNPSGKAKPSASPASAKLAGAAGATTPPPPIPPLPASATPAATEATSAVAPVDSKTNKDVK